MRLILSDTIRFSSFKVFPVICARSLNAGPEAAEAAMNNLSSADHVLFVRDNNVRGGGVLYYYHHNRPPPRRKFMTAIQLLLRPVFNGAAAAQHQSSMDREDSCRVISRSPDFTPPEVIKHFGRDVRQI